MKTGTMKRLTLLALAAAGLAWPLAQAQQVYRIVGADGKVTFSDKPPVADSSARITAANSSAGVAASAGLPFELRQVATKYPVTLYVGENCVPCEAGRSLLTSRGIPFTEKTVTTNEDAQALQRMSGDASLPFVTIGSQQLKGYSDAEWTQFLNAAGYPATSVLPPSYRRPAPTPLISVATAQPPAPGTNTAGARPAPAPRAAAAPPPAPTDNPAGIRF